MRMGISEAVKKFEEAKVELETHIKKGYKSYTGVVFTDEQVKAYNMQTDKVNSYLKAGRKVPDNVLNGRNNLFKTFSMKESIDEVGSNDDLDQAIKRADKFYARNIGSRELINWVTKNYTDRVIFQFVAKYADKLRKRAKEEVKLVEDEIKSHAETLAKHKDLQK